MIWSRSVIATHARARLLARGNLLPRRILQGSPLAERQGIKIAFGCPGDRLSAQSSRMLHFFKRLMTAMQSGMHDRYTGKDRGGVSD